MDCFCHIFCPCLCSREDELDKSYDIIPEKGEYYGDTDFKGAKHGHGMFLFAEGDIYEGEWKKDKMHGFGEYRFKDGKILNGYFEDGNFVGSPPSGVKPPKAKGAPQPLAQESIRSDAHTTREKHNGMSYAFARTVGVFAQNISKMTEEPEDNREREQLVRSPRERQNTKYQSTVDQTDYRVAAKMAMEHQKRERLRQERIARIKQKYNIKT